MAKKRTRAVSLSLDWDSMIKDEETDKGPKAHVASFIAYDRDVINFCTGSTYSGKWNALGMACYGNYIYSHGCEYEGGFEDGNFHGEGTLTYPMGQKIEGLWENGKMVAYKFTHVDGLDYGDNWKYCVMPDRRFNISFREGLQPAGREFMTNQQPERPLYSGMYDTGDGYYNPATGTVHLARDPADYANYGENDSLTNRIINSKISIENIEKTKTEESNIWIHSITMVSAERRKWIIQNCRKGWDEPAGYRPDFYQDWVSGRELELEELERKYEAPDSYGTNSGGSYDRDNDTEENLVTEEKKSFDYAGTGRKLAPQTSKADMGD